MAEDVDDDDELFGELYEKYKGGKLAPEVSLLLRVATSAFLINMTNKMVSSATPGLSDVLRQSPDLMNAFMKATVDSLNQAGPGANSMDPTGGLMGAMMGGAGGGSGKLHPMAAFAKDMFSKEFEPNKSQGPPPAPVETKLPSKSAGIPTKVGTGMQFTSSRPDLNASTTGYTVGGSRGIEVNSGYGSLNEKTPLRQQPLSNFSPVPKQQEQQQSPSLRPEMKGPSSTDLDSILAGLKKKDAVSEVASMADDESVSVMSFRDLDSATEQKRSYKKRVGGSTKPRKQRSENNVSIDL